MKVAEGELLPLECELPVLLIVIESIGIAEDDEKYVIELTAALAQFLTWTRLNNYYPTKSQKSCQTELTLLLSGKSLVEKL